MMATAALPEVKRHDKLAQTNRRTNIALLILVGLACVVLVVGTLAIVDKKLSTIRQSQIHNAQVSAARSDCQNRAFNALLKDARLAFSGDRNPADYAVAVKC